MNRQTPTTVPATGVLSSQELRAAEASGWIDSGHYRVQSEAIQPASVDLRLGERAWALRCSFLPDSDSKVEDRASELAIDELDLRDGAVLERNRPYLIPLIERLHLPEELRARANPKSSTGRLDVFTRVITDRHNRFDEIVPGYSGPLYLEVVPRSFAIRVQERLSLNQVRLLAANTRCLSDQDLRTLHSETPLLFAGDGVPVDADDLPVSDGLFLGLKIAGAEGEPIGFRARQNSGVIDLSKLAAYTWREFWEPVYAEPGGRIVLEPEVFYLLISDEGVTIPPTTAAEMMAYDPTAGELRTHYAGFFDPGFGYSADGSRPGSRAALEVRARDVAFMIEHGQPVCKLSFEPMSQTPDVLYGDELGSNYQGQASMLSKHFVEQKGHVVPLTPSGHEPDHAVAGT